MLTFRPDDQCQDSGAEIKSKYSEQRALQNSHIRSHV